VNHRASFKRLLAPVAVELGLVERELEAQLQSLGTDHMRNAALSRLGASAVHHVFRVTGKRLRPALLLLSAESVGGLAGRRDTLVKLAVGVEFIHSASLVHDDIIDEARSRRGQLSVNARYGNRIAVLAGDVLYTQFFAALGGLQDVDHAGKLRLLALFAAVTKRMCFGEIYEEQIRRSRRAPPLEDYLDTIDNKTASLLSACCEAGALVAGAGEPDVQSLRTFGRSVGMAYQLLDDVADADSIFPGEDLRLLEAAEGYLASANESLRSLSPNPATERMRDLLGFIRLHGSADVPAAAPVRR